ncbi:MAG: Spy/CpxP family protein refolding chaperone [Myxococcales bacterium]|nr:Spy/CpxP family protein refolding chaperone [Myxococcales bacterium]
MFHGPLGRRWRHPSHRRGPGGPGHGGGRGRGFGMRRPLRFLIDRLSLDEAQTAEVARILEDLRLEREQADLDRRRARATLADLIAADTLDAAALKLAAEVRVTAAGSERDAAISTVQRLHALLTAEQRSKLSTLLRAGPFAL